MALKRYACLKQKMSKDPVLADAVNAKMEEYKEKGYIRRINNAEMMEKYANDWYLPIFPVTNPIKSGKIRMVFDAAAKVNVNLSTHFSLLGPICWPDYVPSCWKFREFRFGVVGDICEMFHRVGIKKEDESVRPDGTLGWDQELDGGIADKWTTWLGVLPAVQKVTVPRCYRHLYSTSAKIELHLFCDANENGMTALAYLRFEEGENIECALVGSKTRVAPLKCLSIPRLELQAAVIGARLANTIRRCHRLEISRTVFWTDSRNVLSWLHSDHMRNNQFVAFRVGELWKSKDAWPADIAATKDTAEEPPQKSRRTTHYA
uniref:Uncharacterized protein n=1 Tax=Anopheles christyi TaxID=43041 RepID=A0A182KGD8_9DIPT